MTFGDAEYYKRQYFLARARADAGVVVDTAGIAVKLATIMQAAVILNEEFEFANARALAAEAKLAAIEVARKASQNCGGLDPDNTGCYVGLLSRKIQIIMEES